MKIDTFTLYGGAPIYIEELDLYVKQPKLKEICAMGEEEYYTALGYLLMDGGEIPYQGEDGKEETMVLTPYMMLIQYILADPSVLKTLNKLSSMLFDKHWGIDEETLQLKLISKEEIEVTDELREKLMGLDPEKSKELIEEFYASYETIIPELHWDKLGAVLRTMSKIQDKPKAKKKAKSAKAQAILDKIAASQEKINEGRKSTGFKPFLWTSVSTLSTGDGIPLHHILENYTILQLTDQLTRLVTREESDKQFAMMTQCVSLDKPLANWMGELDKET